MEHAVRRHYDLLIRENQDPVLDPPMLQSYMQKWDGPIFLSALNLTRDKTALEIGVGTGRLALQTAPRCRQLTGIDLSPCTIERAKCHLQKFDHVQLIQGDFLDYPFVQSFDVIYASLVFMHIREKERAVQKAAALLNPGGRLVLSLDKNQEDILDYGSRKIPIYPDDPAAMTEIFQKAGLAVIGPLETEFAHILIGEKG